MKYQNWDLNMIFMLKPKLQTPELMYFHILMVPLENLFIL